LIDFPNSIQLTRCLGGKLQIWVGGEPYLEQLIKRVSTDTRDLHEGGLFVALKGEKYDGHDYLNEAIKCGCTVAVVDHLIDANILQIQVSDTLKALGIISSINRRNFKGRVIGITGSSGKTTVKEMLKAALSQFGSVLATSGNLNNQIGVPLTLLQLEKKHDFAIVEMGASHLGEIAYTSALVKPDIAIITNAGTAHLEGFGSYENVIKTKGEIIDSLNEAGMIVLNGDDPALSTWMNQSTNKKVRIFSLENKTADVSATHIQIFENSSQFDLNFIHKEKFSPEKSLSLSLPLPGRHNVANATATLTVIGGMGLDVVQAVYGLSLMQPVKGRLVPINLNKQVTLIDDTYNANPSSMDAAFRVLLKAKGRKIALVGDMAELGQEAAELHRQAGEKAFDWGIEQLLCVGNFTQYYSEGFGSEALSFDSKARLLKHLLSILDRVRDEPLTLLVKGSRSAAMEQIVDALKMKYLKETVNNKVAVDLLKQV